MIDADQLLRLGQLDNSVNVLGGNPLAVRPPDNGVRHHVGGGADGCRATKGINQGSDGINALHAATLMAFSHHVNSDICHATRGALLSCDGRMSKRSRPPSYSDIQREVGARILWARELVEPNRAEFARTLGLDRTTVQKIEDGDRPPSIFNVLAFAHALRVTPSYILIGSMQGVDGELAAALAAAHPQLANRGALPEGKSDTATDSGTPTQPRKPPVKRRKSS